MMRYEIIEDGKVVNTIVAPLDFAEEHYYGRYRPMPEDLEAIRRNEKAAAEALAEAQTNQIWSLRERLNYILGVLPKDENFTYKVSQAQDLELELTQKREQLETAKSIEEVKAPLERKG
jgi:hypothetical protein